jgi:acyl CoA:acetate/3-ketoacid CoA transferase alpha subunit
MARLLESCTTPEAKKAFHDWAAQRYGKKFAEKAIAFWRWWSDLTGEMQQQIQQIPLSYWPISTALSLMKLGERLVACLAALADLPSVAVSRLENLIRQFTPKRPAPLRLGKTASAADWEYAQKKLGFSDGELDALQQQAESLAAIDVETGEKILTTDVIVEALEASGYDANLVLWKEHRFERQLASREQELEGEKQARLDAQAQVNQSYAQLRATQVEVKEQQAQLQEQEAQLQKQETEIEQTQAEIAQLRQQIAEFQRQSSSQEVADTSGETDGSQEERLTTEIAVPAASAVITEAEEIPNLKQIKPEPETGEPLVTSNDMAEAIAGKDYAPSPFPDGQLVSREQELESEKPDWLDAQIELKKQEAKIQRQRQQTAEVETVSTPLPATAPAHPQKKRKRKRDIFLSEMAQLGVRY